MTKLEQAIGRRNEAMMLARDAHSLGTKQGKVVVWVQVARQANRRVVYLARKGG